MSESAVELTFSERDGTSITLGRQIGVGGAASEHRNVQEAHGAIARGSESSITIGLVADSEILARERHS
jgi:hypothetical protein